MRPVLTHLAMQVPDLDAAIAFYQRYCGMQVVHERKSDSRVVWLAEPGKERLFIFVLLPGAQGPERAESDYSHLGFALGSQAEVDAIAERARTEGCLVWPPRQEPYPVGYYCGIRDPAGNVVEFSYGQPLGPGAPQNDE
jgi:catechol 2,3-dioxygenase-like lactoylglutathione lyase family enzyme